MPPDRDWTVDLFDERYLLFHDRLAAAGPARAEADFLDRALALPAGSRVLDLGCGVGRHAVPLAALGHRVTGLDRSEVMLAQARRRAEAAGVAAQWLGRDMRDLAGLGPFDACVCLYTAFGYFPDAANEALLGGVRETLAPGGRLCLHLANPLALLAAWPGESWREASGGVARETSTYRPMTGRLEATRTLWLPDGRRLELPPSSVRMYAPHEVAALLERAGFADPQVYGGLRDVPFDWKRSPDQAWVVTRG